MMFLKNAQDLACSDASNPSVSIRGFLLFVSFVGVMLIGSHVFAANLSDVGKALESTTKTYTDFVKTYVAPAMVVIGMIVAGFQWWSTKTLAGPKQTMIATVSSSAIVYFAASIATIVSDWK